MSKPLKVLILEDHPFDAEILVSELEKAGFALEWQRVDTEADYLAHLTPALDLIVSDYTMPQFEAPRALQILQEKDLDIPFIVIIGTLREEMGVACLKQGAVDYLIKDRLARLGEAVKRALHQRALHEEKRQALTALRESEERFQTRYQETEALRQAALALVSTVDVDQVFEGILENLQNVVPFDSASLQLLEENRLKIIGGRGFPNLSEIVGVTFGVGPDTPNAAVLKTQQPVIIDDVSQKYPHIFQGVHALAKVRSWLGTPLQIGNRLIGMLTLDKQQPNFYTKNHARITQAYAAQATIAIENARLYKETENRMEQLAVLHELDQAISTSRQLDEVYQAFAKYTAQLLAYDYLSVILKKNGDFFVAYLTGISQPSAKPEQPLPLKVIEWVFAHGQPFLHRDIISDSQFADETILQARGIKSILIMPLWVKGQVFGVWSLGNCQVEAYNSDSTTTAQGLADQLALAIDNTYLTEQAYQEIETRKQVQAALEVERASLTQRVMDRTADLERANLELAQAFRSKDEFLINMGYELRTPLNAILGMAEILQEEVYGPLSQKQEKSVDTIKKSGEHLLALLNDILDFSKIEAGQVK